MFKSKLKNFSNDKHCNKTEKRLKENYNESFDRLNYELEAIGANTSKILFHLGELIEDRDMLCAYIAATKK